MNLQESHKINPQDYFLQSGVDSNGDPIYDAINEIITDYAPAKALRKKVFDGILDTVFQTDKIQLYWNSNLIAEAQLEVQAETSPTVWQGQIFSFQDANVKKIDWDDNHPDWNPNDAYFVGDIIVHNSASWICKRGNGPSSPSPSESPSVSPTESPSESLSESPSLSASISPSASESPSLSVSVSTSPSPSESPSESPSTSPSPSRTASSIEPGVDAESGTYWRQLDPITPYFRGNEVKDIPALSITNAVIGLDVHSGFGLDKLSFYADVPGFNTRIRWQARVKDSAVAWTDNTDPENPIFHKGLRFNVKDYEGAVNKGSMADPEAGWTIHWWTFEPDGKQIDAADARTPKERYEQVGGRAGDLF
jgi:hypothetical protein